MTLTAESLWLYAGALVILWITPGPVFIALTARALTGGFRSAWPLAVGVTIGDGPQVHLHRGQRGRRALDEQRNLCAVSAKICVVARNLGFKPSPCESATKVKPSGLLVSVSSMRCRTSTPDLSTS